jgi:hypothetical protein
MFGPLTRSVTNDSIGHAVVGDRGGRPAAATCYPVNGQITNRPE